jgi:hypothetical protein
MYPPVLIADETMLPSILPILSIPVNFPSVPSVSLWFIRIRGGLWLTKRILAPWHTNR